MINKKGAREAGWKREKKVGATRFTSIDPDARLVAPIIAKTKKLQTSNEGGWILRSGRGQLRENGSTSAAPPAATSRSTFSRQHQATQRC